MLQAKTAIVSTPWTQYGGTQSWGRHGLHFCVDSAGDNGNVELGQTKMCINYLGNVGIGSWSTPNPLPQTMASVHGGRVLEGRDATGFEFIAASSDTTNIPGQFNGAFLIKNMDANGTTPHYAGMAGREGGTGYSGHMDLLFYSGRDNYENNTPQMVIDIYSNVGIGTTTPGYTLDVTGDINFTGALTQNGTTYGGGGSGSSPWVTSGNDISYSTGNVAVNTNTLFVATDAAGRVGIGTSSPMTALHVSSGTAGDCRLVLEADTDNNNEGDNPRIEFWQDGAIQESAIGMTSNRLNLWNSVGSGGIAFHTNSVDGWTNAIERMTIDTNGNVAVDTNTFFVDSVNDRVGIGTTTPGAELHVSGTGAIIVPSGPTVDRPGTLVTGMIRYNTTSLKYEGYGVSAWLDLSIADTISQLYTFTSHTFTKAGGDTRYGPQIGDTITAYGNITPWNDTALFNVTTRGFQLWTVPKTGTYRIIAKGARGGNKSTSASPNYGNTPGYGGHVYADFALTMNTKIVIIVGQQPPTSTGNYRSGSGGGATWVLKPGAYTNTDDVYLVAGGGGGAGPGHYNSGQAGSADASSQGTLGGGGTSHWNSNGGGAGWTADGAPSGARGGVMPSGGAMGGTGTTHGGFGGGGSESGDSAAGGAGATGGRAAIRYDSTGTNTARGGTSYIQPDTLERISGTQMYKGVSYDNDGSVIVQYIP